MQVKLIDRDGDTVRMTTEQIADSIRKMGNPAGKYILIGEYYVTRFFDDTNLTQKQRDLAYNGKKNFSFSLDPVLRFRSSTMPHYSRFQLWRKKWRWNKQQKQLEKKFNANNPLNLIWEPTPFVLEMPWLRLKGKKAVTINVE